MAEINQEEWINQEERVNQGERAQENERKETIEQAGTNRMEESDGVSLQENAGLSDAAAREAGGEQSGINYTGLPVRYYPIHEEMARRAKELNSLFDYRPGSATAEYRRCVDRAAKIAEEQKEKADLIYHEKIDLLLDTYARKLADNMNKGFEIDMRVPSVLVAGASNFPTRKKERQNSARDKNMEEWRQIEKLIDRIQGTGTGGIRSDHPHAIEQLEEKLARLEKSQKLMKDVNAFYRKHHTLEGCPLLDGERIRQILSSMVRSWHPEPKPFPSYLLTNNGSEIRRIKARIEELKQYAETGFTGWEFAGGKAEPNQEAGRLQLFFEEKPSPKQRAQLKQNGFRWAPKAGAWQRLLNQQAVTAAGRMDFVCPISGQKPQDLQPRAEKLLEKKPSMQR